MICKWCGANTPDSKPKCTRCGRPLPPKSDCGGFYDIVPDAKKVIAARSHPTPAASGTPTYIEVPGEPDKKYKILLLSVCAALLVTLILMFVFMGKAGKLQQELDEMEDRSTPSSVTPDDQDEGDGENNVFDFFDILKNQDVKVEIDLSKEAQNDDKNEGNEGSGSKTSKKPSSDKKKDEKPQKQESPEEESPEEETSTHEIFVDAGDIEGFTGMYENGRLELKYKNQLCFSADISTAENKMKATVSYAEELGEIIAEGLHFEVVKRSDESEESEKPAVPGEIADGNTFVYEYESDCEYQLTVTRKNADGGSFIVVITGITAPENAND